MRSLLQSHLFKEVLFPQLLTLYPEAHPQGWPQVHSIPFKLLYSPPPPQLITAWTSAIYLLTHLFHCFPPPLSICLPGSSVVKKLPANAGDTGSIPGSRRSPGEGKGNPLQSSCLENPTDRGAWWATVHGVTKASKLATKTRNRTTARRALKSRGVPAHSPGPSSEQCVWLASLSRVWVWEQHHALQPFSVSHRPGGFTRVHACFQSSQQPMTYKLLVRCHRSGKRPTGARQLIRNNVGIRSPISLDLYPLLHINSSTFPAKLPRSPNSNSLGEIPK